MIPTPTADDFLQAAYDQLGYMHGSLLQAGADQAGQPIANWIERSDWQMLAKQVGAESIFFVGSDPTVVFAKADGFDESALRALYERIWCMARPQILFLATPGTLTALDLTKAPPKADEELGDRDRFIAAAHSIEEVQSRLAAYHRERIETGAVFGEERFAKSSDRSDRALIRDLKIVRQQLADVSGTNGVRKPELRHLHSLIGRAIFLRYLEDREILTDGYFEKIATRRKEWIRLLQQTPSGVALDPRLKELNFIRVLQNKEFTYALFEQLAKDFNGDLFPIEDAEYQRVHQEHLDKLRGFLVGSTTPQQELFFFAYRFDVIPIELISAIYEEFYNERTDKEKNKGTHYTPPALVEFVLSQTLTPEILVNRPRVMDPSCGSGIFLVESFRRMVRHLRAEQKGRRVSPPQLRRILREQIAGVDINEEAIRVAAFSLYLAYLHYQEPREINDERRLPYLKWASDEERQARLRKDPSAQFFDVLVHANAFNSVNGRSSLAVAERFGSGSADVIVGNPPWGYPKKEDTSGQRAMDEILLWCNGKAGRPIGDKELSQAFIHLTLSLLKDGGRAGLLVSSGVFFKHHPNSKLFRKIWLSTSRLRHIVNFAHVRHVFFSGALREAKGISPFVSVSFDKSSNALTEDTKFEYWSAKRTAAVSNTQEVILNRGDMHSLSQRLCHSHDDIWKIYWWGGHRDEALLRRLEQFTPLKGLPSEYGNLKIEAGRGFEVTRSGSASGWLREYYELPSKDLVKYGRQSLKTLRLVPAHVYRKGLQAIYSGRRLLVGRGIKSGGHIVSRLETRKFSFRNSIHGIRFYGFERWQEATITGIFWSSLARYYYFTTSGSWGFWHDEIHLDDVENMPICFPQTVALKKRIENIVSALQEFEGAREADLFTPRTSGPTLAELERELDDAVFDLYGLSLAERDLVSEMCTVGLDLFYENQESAALKPVLLPHKTAGRLSDVQQAWKGLPAYLKTFLGSWADSLNDDTEFMWRVLSPPSGAPLLAISFSTHFKADGRSGLDDLSAGWSATLARLDTVSVAPMNSSQIFVDTFFRYISETEIIFIKRNEQRFWTKTAAREDAESAQTYLMNLADIQSKVPHD
jgi:type I restriction-modification system DNA methylase subunit